MLIGCLALLGLVAQEPAGLELTYDRARVSQDVGGQGNVRGGALPDVGDELAWEMPADLTPGVYQVVVVGRSGARIEGLDFVASYRVMASDRAYPRGTEPHEITVYVPDGVQPTMRSKAPDYYVFEAPMHASEKLYLQPGDEVRVRARVGWAHVWTLRLEPVPPDQQHDLSLHTERLAGLFAPTEPARFVLSVTNWRDERRALWVEAVALDETGAEAARASATAEVDARARVEIPIELRLGRFGPFYAQVSVYAGEEKLGAAIRGFGVTPAPSPREVPDSSPFGIHKTDLSEWPLIGAKWVRLWDTGDTWNRYERERGKIEWEKLDEKLAQAEDLGVKVLYVFAYTPTWASARPEEPHYTGAGAQAEAKDIADWRNFVRAVARRYRGRMGAYEVWNEPNAGFFSGTVEAYEKLLEAAYEVIKKEDPAAPVLGISGTGGYLEWMEEAFKLGALKYMDVVSVHTYTTPRSPEEANLVGRYQSTHELIRKYGDPKPVWNTEVGIWQPERERGRPMTAERIAERAPEETRPNWQAGWPYVPITEQAAAEDCVRTYLITLASGVERLFWYAWYTQSLPMYTDDNEPRLMSIAYGAMTARLSRARFVERVDLGSRDLFFLIFDTPDGPLAAVWSAQRSPTRVAIPAAGKTARLYDLWGNESEARAEQVEVVLTGRPVYVAGLPIESLRRVTLAEEEIVLESVEAEVSSDVGESNVKEHTSGPHHGQRRVMGLPDAGDAITWTLPPTLPPGEYELAVDGYTGGRPPGTDYIGNYRVEVQGAGPASPAESGTREMGLRAAPGFEADNPREGRFYGLMMAEEPVVLRPGDKVRVSSKAGWAFVGPLKLRRVKAAESKRQLGCPRLGTPVALDGEAGEWQGVAAYAVDRREQVWIGVADRFASTDEKDAWQGAEDCSGSFRTGWREDGLAVLVEVRDDRIVPRAGQPLPRAGQPLPPVEGVGAWEADCVEVFLDARAAEGLGTAALGEGTYQVFCPAPEGAETRELKLSGRVPEGARAFGRRTESGYAIELWIPEGSLGEAGLKAGRRLGFDVAIDDADAQADGRPVRKSQIVFHGTADNFQDPSAYALMLLEP